MIRCEYCGGEVRLQSSNVGVCQICARTFSGEHLRKMRMVSPPEFNVVNDEQERRRTALPAIIVGLIIMAMFSGIFVGRASLSIFGMPIVPAIILISVFSSKNQKKVQNQGRRNTPQMQMQNPFEDTMQMNRVPRLRPNQPQPVVRYAQGMAVGERLETAADYLEAFRILPLTSMPFRAEAGEAIDQLNAMIIKQQGIATLLPPGHPYYQTVNDAVNYFLRNMKQILFRMRYCDQNDMSRRAEHTAFFRRTLDDNAALLHDFETFMIELSQIEDVQGSVPCLDVLAQSLQSMREPVPDEEEFLRQMNEYNDRSQMMQ